MIRGPVLPQAREALWALVAGRLENIERGLLLVAEGVDCSGGQFGLVEGLARDANGGPVLVLVAVDGDPLLPARALTAAEFLARVGDSLGPAVAEASFCAGRLGRVFVIGGAAGDASLDLLRRLAFPNVHLCRLEAFRIDGSERFAARWIHEASDRAAPNEVGVAFDVPAAWQRTWEGIQRVCGRVDPTVRIDGGRFVRRITWRGRLLGEVLAAEGELRGLDHEGRERPLGGDRDVRAFGDALLRRYAQVAGIDLSRGQPGPVPIARTRSAGREPGPVIGESLRETLNASRVSPEESSALGAATTDKLADDKFAGDKFAGGDNESAADYVARMVATQERSRAAKRPPD